SATSSTVPTPSERRRSRAQMSPHPQPIYPARTGLDPAGMPVRQKLRNLSRICDGKRIRIDFSEVPIISSSFADEVFGKLFADLGPLEFMKAFEFYSRFMSGHSLLAP